jgi:hypothetical protein
MSMMSTKCATCYVEFFGGPIDGHVETFEYPPKPFIGVTASRTTRIGHWLWRWLPWTPVWTPPRTTCPRTVAVYELYEADDLLRYRHTGSAAALPPTLPCVRVDVSRPTGRGPRAR